MDNNRLIYALKISALYIILCCGNFTAHAQRYPFFNLNVESGLIQSQATGMVQDKYGHLWVATLGGLSRYDGKSFTNYSVRDGMLSNTVQTIASDRNGNLWIGGPKGLSEFNGRRFKHYIF